MKLGADRVEENHLPECNGATKRRFLNYQDIDLIEYLIIGGE